MSGYYVIYGLDIAASHFVSAVQTASPVLGTAVYSVLYLSCYTGVKVGFSHTCPVVAHAASLRHLNAKVRFQSMWDLWWTKEHFLGSLRFFSANYQSNNAAYLSIDKG
jgi:hypothetical protein